MVKNTHSFSKFYGMQPRKRLCCSNLFKYLNFSKRPWILRNLVKIGHNPFFTPCPMQYAFSQFKTVKRESKARRLNHFSLFLEQ